MKYGDNNHSKNNTNNNTNNNNNTYGDTAYDNCTCPKLFCTMDIW